MSENGQRTANRAIFALTVISILALVAGVLAVAYHAEAGAVLAVVSGAIGGIVAIVLREKSNGVQK